MAKKNGIFSQINALGSEIVIDMGTSNTVIFKKGAGIVLREPSVVAIDRRTQEVIAVGKEAKEMLGKTPAQILAVKPVLAGAAADFDVCCAMLKIFVKKASGAGVFSRPTVLFSLPAGATEVERIAAEEVAKHAGAGDIRLIEAPMAAAIGAGVSPLSPKGFMVVSMGAGITEVAVLALGDVIASTTVRTGGDAIDKAISRYIKRKYAIQIGELTAEEIKIKIGSAFPSADSFHSFMEVRGRSVAENLPKSITIHEEEIRGPILEELTKVIAAVVETTEVLPPEIAADLLETGILLTGGGGLLSGLDRYLQEATHLRVELSERPLDAVAEGLGRSLSTAVSKREPRR
ncbi:MAG: rod shape-determining protein [Oscillospiraceae bacterium]